MSYLINTKKLENILKFPKRIDALVKENIQHIVNIYKNEYIYRHSWTLIPFIGTIYSFEKLINYKCENFPILVKNQLYPEQRSLYSIYSIVNIYEDIYKKWFRLSFVNQSKFRLINSGIDKILNIKSFIYKLNKHLQLNFFKNN